MVTLPTHCCLSGRFPMSSRHLLSQIHPVFWGGSTEKGEEFEFCVTGGRKGLSSSSVFSLMFFQLPRILPFLVTATAQVGSCVPARPHPPAGLRAGGLHRGSSIFSSILGREEGAGEAGTTLHGSKQTASPPQIRKQQQFWK